MVMVTGGELVVRALRDAGVDKLFALHGANIDSIFQSCLDSGIRIIDTRHEMNAGHAAEGQARISQGLGVALVTAGGGLTNVITSMANAMMDRTPVLYLCGSGSLKQRQMNSLQHDLDQVALATPVTKWAHHVTCVEHLPRLIAQAIRIATQAPRGPVMLDLPWDVLMAAVEEADLAATGTASMHSGTVGDADIARILETLASAARPVIVLGTEAVRSDTRAAVEALATATGIPVFSEYEGLGLLRDLPDNVFGGLVQGLYGLGDQTPDVVLMLGLRFGLYTAHDSGLLVPKTARIIQVDPDARELGRLQAIEFGLVAEVGAAIRQLAEAAKGGDGPDRSAWQATVRAHVRRRLEVVSGHITEKPGMLHPLRASQILADQVNGDIAVVADGALTYLWLSEVIGEARPAALLCHSYLSSMGCGFGIAVGAQAAVAEGKRVILVTGDGAVGYSLAEFDTAVRNGLPLIVVVMNNRSWGATLHFQRIVVGENRVTGTRLENGRYELAASAFGAANYYAEDAEGFQAALQTALSRNEPACINVLVDVDPVAPEELVVMGMDPFKPIEEQKFGF